jgi:hypothetical protein
MPITFHEGPMHGQSLHIEGSSPQSLVVPYINPITDTIDHCEYLANGSIFVYSRLVYQEEMPQDEKPYPS